MAEYTHVGPGLPPLHGAQANALILGSFPSPKSREQGFFYGHKQNRFWPMMAALTGEPVPKREDIEAKKQIILRHGLALWDTLESCTITGASDASIRDVVPNDIAGLLAKAPIEAVFCNGLRHIRSIQSISSRSAASRRSGCPAPAPPMPPAGRKNYGRSGRKNCRAGSCLECRADLPDLPGAPL